MTLAENDWKIKAKRGDEIHTISLEIDGEWVADFVLEFEPDGSFILSVERDGWLDGYQSFGLAVDVSAFVEANLVMSFDDEAMKADFLTRFPTLKTWIQNLANEAAEQAERDRTAVNVAEFHGEPNPVLQRQLREIELAKHQVTL